MKSGADGDKIQLLKVQLEPAGMFIPALRELGIKLRATYPRGCGVELYNGPDRDNTIQVVIKSEDGTLLGEELYRVKGSKVEKINP